MDVASATKHAEIGLVAGGGRYPLAFCEAARERGVRRLTVAAFHDETDPGIAGLADDVEWVRVGQLGRTIKAFVRRSVPAVVFAGRIRPRHLFKGMRPDLRLVRLLGGLKTRNADTLFSAVAAEFERDGVHVLPATTFLEHWLADAGRMGRRRVSQAVMADVEYGWRIAREVSRLDIGQTVVVKNGTVLAVEGFEGTDRAIRRGGELGHGGVTVVKVAKPGHDARFDVPCVGDRTVESLRAAGAAALAVQQGMTLFIDKPVLVRQFDAAKIAVLGVDATTFSAAGGDSA